MARTQVQSELLAVNSISGTIIADNAITATHIATNAISGTLVQDGGIVTVMIAANNVTATKIVTDAIQTRHIADDQVTEAKLANAINTSIAAKLPLAGGTMTGDLGIGGDPGAKLDVNSGTTNTIAHFHSTDDNGFIELKDDDTQGYLGVQDDYVYIGGAPSRSTQNLVINDGDGKVGIGTTSPSHTLHVHSDDAKGFLLERDSGSNAANLNEMSTHYSLSILNRTSGSYLNFGGNSSHTVLQATDGAGSAAAKHIILNPHGGNVGIGVTDPDGELHVESAGNADVYVERTSGAKIHLQAQSAFTAIGAASNHDLGLMTNASTRMRIDNTGRVGINRTPSKSNSKLEVGGADNVGLIHVEASGNFASWGIGSNQSKFYYNDTQMMGLTNEGVMKLMGGVTGGRQDLVFNNGAMSLANNASYTLTGVLNTAALVSIGANRSNVGVTYDHCIIFAETGTAATVVGNPSGRIALNSSSTDNKLNVYVSAGNLILVNKIASTIGVTIAAFVFQGN